VTSRAANLSALPGSAPAPDTSTGSDVSGTAGRFRVGIAAETPAPAADAARLSKWLGKVSNEAGYFEAVARKLRAGDKAAAEHLVNKLTTEANAANNVVIPFEFTYCRLEPGRFT